MSDEGGLVPLTNELFNLMCSEQDARIESSAIREIMGLLGKPDVYHFAGGMPAQSLFPDKVLYNEIIPKVFMERGPSILQYSGTQGDPELINQLIRLCEKDTESVTPDNIQVTVSSQQGLDLLGKTLLNEGDTIIVGHPTYLGAIQAFRAYGINFVSIPLDKDGMRVDILREKLEKGIKPKFVYNVPDFQNPAGVTLPLERRLDLINLASEYDTLIVEDLPYRCLRYEGEDIPSLYSLDTTGRVISLRTFSKMAWPGFRLGWIVAQGFMINRFTKNTQPVILCPPAFTQAVMAEYLASGKLDEVLPKAVDIYRDKMHTMLDALKKHMPDHKQISWTKPEGGLFIWVTLPECINTDMHEEFYNVLTKQEDVVYVPGSQFYADNDTHNTMRLNFSLASKKDIEEGIEILGHVVGDFLEKYE